MAAQPELQPNAEPPLPTPNEVAADLWARMRAEPNSSAYAQLANALFRWYALADAAPSAFESPSDAVLFAQGLMAEDDAA